MKQTRAVTLVELVIALSLIGVLIAITTSIGSSFYAMKKDFLDKQQASIQGHLATAAIFERVLRASAVSSSAAFTVSPDGKTVEYSRSGLDEKIWLDGDTVKYDDGGSVKVLLQGVRSLSFAQDYMGRLAVAITLSNGENLRTAVQPRNQFTPPSVIN
jgi:prepilin-type N-terminal cleavage/methylation domain-containing protein